VRIGDSVVMVSESQGEWKTMPGAFYMYVSDAAAVLLLNKYFQNKPADIGLSLVVCILERI
jgi:hypothetical protein